MTVTGWIRIVFSDGSYEDVSFVASSKTTGTPVVSDLLRVKADATKLTVL